jgi:predicted nuclease of predicted toxin-antitoxin system
MRLLADENFPRPAVEAIRKLGHDLAWITEDSSGSLDEEVLARCATERRVLLTFDKDFGELAFRRGLPAECGIILFRVSPRSPEEVAAIAVATLALRTDWAGSFTVVRRGRVRMTPIPERRDS